MKNKLIYVVVASSGMGMAKNLRSAILDAGIEIGNDPEPVEIHQLPVRSVLRVDLDNESQTITPVWSPEMNTLVGQQIRNQLCTVNHFKAALTETSIMLHIDDVVPSNSKSVPPPKPKTTRKPRNTKKT